MRVLIVVAALMLAGCGPMFDSPLAPQPTPWVLPSPGPSPCPFGYVGTPRVDVPLVCFVPTVA